MKGSANKNKKLQTQKNIRHLGQLESETARWQAVCDQFLEEFRTEVTVPTSTPNPLNSTESYQTQTEGTKPAATSTQNLQEPEIASNSHLSENADHSEHSVGSHQKRVSKLKNVALRTTL